MYGANVIIFEGILSFYNMDVLNMLDMKIFVDTDADIRLARRLRRYFIIKTRFSWLQWWINARHPWNLHLPIEIHTDFVNI